MGNTIRMQLMKIWKIMNFNTEYETFLYMKIIDYIIKLFKFHNFRYV
jgi:hypothetical protein